ncbi:UDP-N-acetylmuramoyl-tripeptide--D-alanyl-D-alanine ligase [Bacteroides sp. 51]|uniref:UDP-N-acetylmuramoyl-tripeptide--D-alanyl-D- alanine ligase n=1 Tax=Bacteroides sp. 51 TaxID=2302938 RepID=UPI0013D36DAC|nr:UDP-N-acetylmuramoyl-tripeptide--D-alanyl-D-alanine ligase [Bacteroides sp. 51]NDV81038.1 UDP-N-acetylmuramoyl-tripeptide--D-alanyl-D-alanine ligase [Bacteroides sp. 51]
MNTAALYQIFQASTGVTTDSRNCPEGSIFFALKGDSFNGNAFAHQALEKGCIYAVIDEAQYAVEGDSRYIVVDNVLRALQLLANHHRRQFKLKVIGITGTNGKTTTKELIAAVLSKSYHVLYTLGNLNNHIGVPLTLLRLAPEHEIAIIEMGASHPGDIKELVDIAEPDYGIITNVGKAHLEGFGSFEGVIKTKGELYDFLRQKNGPVFIHHDNPYLMEMAKGMNQIAYGTEDDLYINGNITDSSLYLGITWKAGKNHEPHDVKTQLIGNYNFSNVLAAITIGHYFGITAKNIDKALNEYTPQNNRSQLKQTGNNALIIDAYNANPTSMMAALENFRDIAAAGKMLIIGDMKELGADSAAEHQRIIDFIDTCNFEQVALVGDLFAATRHNYTSYRNVQELIEVLKQEKPQGKTILIKGSNSIKLNLVVEFL